ncbi:MAG TPA: hypothetical protein VEY71_03050, partial [Chitinophagales bacterium]|nr:hypothetical protein [Chitinophagales bacterium]
RLKSFSSSGLTREVFPFEVAADFFFVGITTRNDADFLNALRVNRGAQLILVAGSYTNITHFTLRFARGSNVTKRVIKNAFGFIRTNAVFQPDFGNVCFVPVKAQRHTIPDVSTATPLFSPVQ